MTEKPFKVKPSDNPYFKCPFPGCVGSFQKEDGKPDTCKKHRGMIADVLFILDHLKPPEPAPGPAEDTSPKIFVPKPGMSAKAIEEARQAARK